MNATDEDNQGVEVIQIEDNENEEDGKGNEAGPEVIEIDDEKEEPETAEPPKPDVIEIDEAKEDKAKEQTQPPAGKGISFSDATDGLKQQVIGAKLSYECKSRFELSVYIPDLPDNPTDDQQAAAVEEIMKSLLKRFKHLTKRVAILPWSNASVLPSIEKSEQIPHDLNVLRSYIRNHILSTLEGHR